MLTDVEYPPEQTAASLVSGILGDLQQLVDQQFQLTRREIEVELRQRAEATAVFGLGMGFLFLAAISLCLSLSHLLHWLASPIATDPAWFPLWACHAAVAVVLAIIGVIVACAGRTKFKSIESFHNPLNEILQEQLP